MDLTVQNRALKEAFLNALRGQRVAGCYLIEGDPGTGKTDFALFAASAVCCHSPKPDRSPCGTCPSCRHIADRCHVDVFHLAPEEEGKSVSVDAVREMLKNSYVLPSESDWQVFILEDCDSLNKAAQNALLKSIEEPRPNTLFLLLTRDRSRLLPTVISRAVLMKTVPLSEDEIESVLTSEGIPEQTAASAARLSGGSLGLARKISRDPEQIEASGLVEAYFHALADSASFVKLCLLLPCDGTQKKDFLLFLSLFKTALRDLVLSTQSANVKKSFFTDEAFAADLASILSLSRAVSLFDLCDDLTRALQGNANLFTSIATFHLKAKNLTRKNG